MRNLILLLVVLVFTSCSEHIYAQNDDDIFTIYLVRHSEKDLNATNYSNPPLSKCGEKRSEFLNQFLKDVPLEVIYSTDYIRTLSTATPTAKSKNLEIMNYDPRKLEVFSQELINRQQDAVVVGHSNTTAVLAGLLVDETLGAFDLEIYDRIYQVVICNSKKQLHLLHLPLDCQD